MEFLLLLLAAFFIGSIPSGFLIGRVYGVDLRSKGSGNVGATNANRVIGKKAGLITLACDVMKGILALWLPALFPVTVPGLGGGEDARALFGLAALVGHCYSPFLRFKGGKGVATGGGVFLILAPVQTSIAIAVFAAALKWKRYVSLGSILAAITLPTLLWLSPDAADRTTAICATFASALIIYRHKENISRLKNGAESKL